MGEFLGNSAFFSILISILAFELGSQIKNKLKLAVFNPLLIAIVTVMAVLTVLDIEYETYKQSAQFLSWLLTPATVCLAIPLYEQLSLLKKNAKAILAGILAGTLTSLAVVGLMCYLFGLNRALTVSLLPKSITTAMGMVLSEQNGGIAALTTVVIIVTGILGSLIGIGVSLILLKINEKRIAGRPDWTPRVDAVYKDKPQMDDLGCGGVQ